MSGEKKNQVPENVGEENVDSLHPVEPTEDKGRDTVHGEENIYETLDGARQPGHGTVDDETLLPPTNIVPDSHDTDRDTVANLDGVNLDGADPDDAEVADVMSEADQFLHDTEGILDSDDLLIDDEPDEIRSTARVEANDQTVGDLPELKLTDDDFDDELETAAMQTVDDISLDLDDLDDLVSDDPDEKTTPARAAEPTMAEPADTAGDPSQTLEFDEPLQVDDVDMSQTMGDTPSNLADEPEDKTVMGRPAEQTVGGQSPTAQDASQTLEFDEPLRIDDVDMSQTMGDTPSNLADEPEDKTVIGRSAEQTVGGQSPEAQDAGQTLEFDEPLDLSEMDEAADEPEDKTMMGRPAEQTIGGQSPVAQDASQTLEFDEPLDLREMDEAADEPEDITMMGRPAEQTIGGQSPVAQDAGQTLEFDEPLDLSEMDEAADEPEDITMMGRPAEQTIAGQSPVAQDQSTAGEPVEDELTTPGRSGEATVVNAGGAATPERPIDQTISEADFDPAGFDEDDDIALSAEDEPTIVGDAPAPSGGNIAQTLEFSELPPGIDSALDQTLAGPSPTAENPSSQPPGAVGQTIEFNEPVSLGDDTIGGGAAPGGIGQTLEFTEPPVFPDEAPQDASAQDATAQDASAAIGQTLEFTEPPIIPAGATPADGDSAAIGQTVEFDEGSFPAERANDQTLDSDVFPVPIDLNDQGGIQQTLDSAVFPVPIDPSQQGGPDQTLDSDVFPSPAEVEADSSKTVDHRHGSQTVDAASMGAIDKTLDSDVFPVAPGDPNQTVGFQAGAQTVDFGGQPVSHPQPGQAAPATGPNLAQTMDSDVFPVGGLPGIGMPGGGGLAGGGIAKTLDSTDGVEGLSQADVTRMTNIWATSDYQQATPGTSLKTNGVSLEARAYPTLGDKAGGTQPDTMTSLKGREAGKKGKSQPTLVIQKRAWGNIQDKGKTKSDYEIESILGEGGMGTVYNARQASIDRTVALKTLKKGSGDTAEQREKFLSEAVVTGDLEHPNIVPIYDLGMNPEGGLFYAMKRVEGDPWMDKIQTMSLGENIEILMKVCDAMAYAHAKQIVHRDLKPENVMLGGFGEVLVMDWGLAIPSDGRLIAGIELSVSMGGTPAYMAPEMAVGPFEKIGLHSDIYLLGAMLFEMITDSPPHTGADVMKCLFAAAKNKLVEVDEEKEEDFGELLDIARQAMHTDPAQRHSSVEDFQEAIRDYLKHTDSIKLSTGALEDLEQAEETDDYQDYSRALFGFQEAISMWDGNTRAKSGLQEAKLAYAKSALNKGDFDLGASLLDTTLNDHKEVFGEIQVAQQEREAKEQRLKAMRKWTRIGIAVFIGGMVIAGTFSAIQAKKATDEAERARVAQSEAVRKGEQAAEEAKKARLAEAEALKQKTAADEAKEQADNAADDALAQKTAADKAKGDADKAAADALAQKAIADKQKIAADQAADRANKAATEAQYQAYISTIGLAAAKIDENAFDAARQMLQDNSLCPTQLRGWEWIRLWWLCTQEEGNIEAGVPLDTVAFSPDGSRFVTAGWTGQAKIWEHSQNAQANGLQAKMVTSLAANHGEFVYAAAFTPDGKYLVTGAQESERKFLKLWDAITGEFIMDIGGDVYMAGVGNVTVPSDAIYSIRFSQDGKLMLTAGGHKPRANQKSTKGLAVVWDMTKLDTQTKQSPVPFATLFAHRREVWSAEFRPEQPEKALKLFDSKQTQLVGEEVEPVVESLDGEKVDTILRGLFASRKLNLSNDLVVTVETPKSTWLIIDRGNRRLYFVDRIKDLNDFFDIHQAAYVPPKQIATAGDDGFVNVWESAKGLSHRNPTIRQVGQFRGHDGPVYAVAYSPRDGKIASGGEDKRVLVWDPKDVSEFNYENAIQQATLVASIDDIEIARPKYVALLGHTAAVRSLSFDETGQRILSAGHDNTVQVWNAEQVPLVEQEKIRSEDIKSQTTLRGHGKGVRACAFSPDGRLVLSGSHDGTARLWKIDTYEETRKVARGRVLEGHEGDILSATFGKGNSVLTASRDRSAIRWDFQSGEATQTYVEGHNFLAASVVFFPNGKKMVTAAVDNTARIWDVKTGTEVARLDRTGLGAVAAVYASSSGGEWILTGGEQITESETGEQYSLAKVWKLERNVNERRYDARVVHKLKDHEGTVQAVAFSSDGTLLLTGDANGRCNVWERETGRLLHRLPFHTDAITAVAFLPNSKGALTASQDGTMALWNTSTGKKQGAYKHSQGDHINSIAVTPDGSKCLTSCLDGRLRLWDLRTERVIRFLELKSDKGSPESVAISPADGKRALTIHSTESSSYLQLWDLETGQPLSADDGRSYLRTTIVGGVQFSPTGDQFVIVGGDNARLFDIPAIGRPDVKKPSMVFIPHDSVASANFSNDGQLVVTSSLDQTARIWDADTGKDLCKLRGGHTERVTSAVFSPDDNWIVTSSEDGTARAWRVTRNGKSVTADVDPDRTFQHDGPIYSASFSADGVFVLTASEDRTARIWEFATGTQVCELGGDDGHDYGVLHAAFEPFQVSARPSSLKVVTGGKDNKAMVWSVDLATWKAGGTEIAKKLYELEGHTAAVTSVALSKVPTVGNQVLLRALTGSDDFTAKLWALPLDTKAAATGPPAAATGPNGAPANATGGNVNPPAGANPAANAAPAANIANQPAANQPAGDKEQQAKEILTLKGHEKEVTSVAFSGDGQYVLTGSRDQTAIIWLAAGWGTAHSKPNRPAPAAGPGVQTAMGNNTPSPAAP